MVFGVFPNTAANGKSDGAGIEGGAGVDETLSDPDPFLKLIKMRICDLWSIDFKRVDWVTSLFIVPLKNLGWL